MVNVGIIVSIAEGISVGKSDDGITVGFTVSFAFGFTLGFTLGFTVDVIVGFTVGFTVDFTVGFTVGLSEGDFVFFFVGTDVEENIITVSLKYNCSFATTFCGTGRKKLVGVKLLTKGFVKTLIDNAIGCPVGSNVGKL